MTMRTAGGAATATGLTVALVLALAAGPATASPSAPPEAPDHLRVTAVAPDRLTVAWDPVPRATQYKLQLVPLEPFGGFRATSTSTTGFTYTGLVPDLAYKVTVRAYVPANYPLVYSDLSIVTTRTTLPEGYQAPTRPTGLTVERDADGQITRVSWNASGGSNGPLTYQVHLESPDQPWINFVWWRTTLTSMPGSAIPFNDGLLSPGETLRLFVTATDRVPKTSPPSEPVTMVCCPM